jgi:hypothetical protein
MWTLGHAVREVERSDHYVVVEETATTGAVMLFGAFACLTLAIFRNVLGLVLAFFFASLAVYAAVRSSFVADKGRGVLVIKRQIGPWNRERHYDARAIDRVFVPITIKGNGLAVRFKSGRRMSLTMSLGFDSDLEGAAAALNEFLHTPHRERIRRLDVH